MLIGLSILLLWKLLVTAATKLKKLTKLSLVMHCVARLFFCPTIRNNVVLGHEYYILKCCVAY